MEEFKIFTSSEILVDLKERLIRNRWPDEVEGAGWDYGTSLIFLRDLCDYWVNDYDWKKVEEKLNKIPQYMVEIDGYKIHFVYVKAKKEPGFPIVLTSGWPSSFVEYEKLIGPLAFPGKFGFSSQDSFDLIIPTMPGFGFSGPVSKRGFIKVDDLWRKLVVEVLGYDSFVAHGTDVGARVTSDLGRFHSDVVKAIHIASVDLDWPEDMPGEFELSDEEKDYIRRTGIWEKEEGAYAEIQGTYPQTVAYALNDSPIGLASWIIEKYYKWSDCSGDLESVFSKDELITNVMIYWITETINSSMRRYLSFIHIF